MRGIRRFFNSLKDGLKGIWKHRSMGFASIVSTFATLFILGLILIMTVTINFVAMDVQDKVDEVDIFIKKEASEEDIKVLEKKINDFPVDKKVSFRESDEALELMKESWGDDAGILEGITSKELLPASFIVNIEDISKAGEFVDYIKDETMVDEVQYYQDIVEKVYTASNYIKIIGAVLVLVLIVVSLFIISNTIKLTVFARSEEISVMKYVGATNNRIRIPFIIEGLVFGVIGSLLAFLAIYYLYEYGYGSFGNIMVENYSVYLIDPIYFKNSLMQIFLSLGIGIGVIGSIFSMKKYLNV